MKIRCMTLMLMGLALVLTGCAEKNAFSNYANAVKDGNTAQAQALERFFETKASRDAEVVKSLAGNETAAVLYGIMSSQQDKEILLAFRPQTIQAPTTNADIGLAVANKTIPTLGLYGATAFIGGKVVDALKGAGGVNMTGDGNTYTHNTGDTTIQSQSPTTTTTINEAPAEPEAPPAPAP